MAARSSPLGAAGCRSSSRAAALRPERGHGQLTEPVAEPFGHLVAARRREDHDAVAGHPAGGEGQRVERAEVEPLHVVDDQQQRPLTGRPGQQRQHPQVDQQTVAVIVGVPERRPAQAQCHQQGLALLTRQVPRPVKEGLQEPAQSREDQLPLVLVPGGAQNVEALPRRSARGGVQQHALARTGLAHQHPGGSHSVPGVPEQPVDVRHLLLMSDEGRSGRGDRPVNHGSSQKAHRASKRPYRSPAPPSTGAPHEVRGHRHTAARCPAACRTRVAGTQARHVPKHLCANVLDSPRHTYVEWECLVFGVGSFGLRHGGASGDRGTRRPSTRSAPVSSASTRGGSPNRTAPRTASIGTDCRW